MEVWLVSRRNWGEAIPFILDGPFQEARPAKCRRAGGLLGKEVDCGCQVSWLSCKPAPPPSGCPFSFLSGGTTRTAAATWIQGETGGGGGGPTTGGTMTTGETGEGAGIGGTQGTPQGCRTTPCTLTPYPQGARGPCPPWAGEGVAPLEGPGGLGQGLMTAHPPMDFQCSTPSGPLPCPGRTGPCRPCSSPCLEQGECIALNCPLLCFTVVNIIVACFAALYTTVLCLTVLHTLECTNYAMLCRSFLLLQSAIRAAAVCSFEEGLG